MAQIKLGLGMVFYRMEEGSALIMSTMAEYKDHMTVCSDAHKSASHHKSATRRSVIRHVTAQYN
jgi:hypothetical protein